MKVLNDSHWKAVLLLSIVVPVSLLATFKLTGLLGEPAAITETKTLEPVTWEFEKSDFSPHYPLWFSNPNNSYVSSFYSDGLVSIIYTVVPDGYIVNHSIYESSAVLMWSNLTASIKEGFIERVHIRFYEAYELSEVRLSPTVPNNIVDKLVNVSVQKWMYSFSGDWNLGEYEKALVEAVGEDEPHSITFNFPVDWILKAQQNVSQQLEITAEVTYFNGTSHVKVVLPILIRMIADIGNTFETARTINPGNYTASLSAYDDDVDCYKIWLAKNQKITIMAVLRSVGINLTLYDVNEEPRASVAGSPEFTPYNTYSDDPKPLEEITYTADVEGYWYIKVAGIFDEGIYLLTVRVEP